jgi:hypothetical protein
MNIGWTYVWLSISLLMMSALSSSVKDVPSWGFWFLLLFSASAVDLLVRELRRDLHQLCVFWCYLGFLFALIGFVSVLGELWKPASLALAVLILVSWAASIVYLIRAQLARGKSPLLERMPEDQVREVAGIQVAIEPMDPLLVIRGPFHIGLLVQNCWDCERTVSAIVRTRSGWFGFSRGAIIDDSAARVTLKPGELGCWTLPVYVSSPKRTAISIDVGVSGLDGRRMYSQRARSLPGVVPRWLTVLLALASLGLVWVWGGGMWLKLGRGPRTVSYAPQKRSFRSLKV